MVFSQIFLENGSFFEKLAKRVILSRTKMAIFYKKGYWKDRNS